MNSHINIESRGYRIVCVCVCVLRLILFIGLRVLQQLEILVQGN